MNETATLQERQPSLHSTLARLAAVIGTPHYPAGDRAALRRWALASPCRSPSTACGCAMPAPTCLLSIRPKPGC